MQSKSKNHITRSREAAKKGFYHRDTEQPWDAIKEQKPYHAETRRRRGNRSLASCACQNFKKLHVSSTEESKIQQNQQESRSFSPYSYELEIVIFVNPVNPVNPVKAFLSALSLTGLCPASVVQIQFFTESALHLRS
jgi:hypothetical protein